jgi:predicted nucleotidyltransferase/HEPN domain-containing protein
MQPIYPKQIMKIQLPVKSRKYNSKISQIADIILENDNKKRIAFIILYGSFARGNWVYNKYLKRDGTMRDYASDIDILVIIRGADKSYIGNLEDKIDKDLEKENLDISRHHPSIICEPLRRVNYNLERKQFFFHDIIKEGILLYDDDKSRIAEPRDLSIEERKGLSEGYFKRWFKSGETFLLQCQNAIRINDYKNAAFQLHQATESFFYCTLLTLTGYTPKLHNLFKLKRMAINHSPKFIDIFPQNNKEEKRLFKLLKDAYIESRYGDDYQITKEELEYLAKQVEQLKIITKEVC